MPTDKPLAGKRLLISFAHPDDESFGIGGAIAKYVADGVEVFLICSTNGDAGTVDAEQLDGFNTIGELRLHELQCAADTLGMKEVITYGYRDSGMDGTPENNHPDALVQADENLMTGRVVREIRRIRPEVVVTFDEYGGYGHPDHRYMHRVTTRAFHIAGDPSCYPEQLNEGLEPFQPAKLYYTGFPKGQLRLWIWRERLTGNNPRRIGKNKDIDLVASLDRIGPYHALVPIAAYHDAWDAAARCHASQLSPRHSGSWSERLERLLFRSQGFSRAYPPPAPREAVERDLFAGV